MWYQSPRKDAPSAKAERDVDLRITVCCSTCVLPGAKAERDVDDVSYDRLERGLLHVVLMQAEIGNVVAVAPALALVPAPVELREAS